MIRVSTRGRYALRAMVDLALHSGIQPVLCEEIAARQEISPAYASQLFAKLVAAGLVEGIKGPGGGYRLARPAAAITAGDILRAVEGPVALVHCVDPATPPSCKRVEQCALRQLWSELSQVIIGYLDSVTLQGLCETAQRISAHAPSTDQVPSGCREASSGSHLAATLGRPLKRQNTGEKNGQDLP